MSRQVRYRVAALVLGGLLLGAPLLINGTASADQVTDGARQVVFDGGGMLAISCRSQPEVGSLTVPADSTVRVVNRTGHSARLRLGGTTKGTVADNGATEVVFRRGTTAVQLSPTCALGDESTPLLVTAVPTDPATMPDPMPAPTDTDGPTGPVAEPAQASTPSAGSALPDAVLPAAHPQRPVTANAAGAVRTTMSRPSVAIAAASASQTMPQGGSAARIKTKSLRGTGGRAHAFSGMPPGDDRALLSGVPTIGLSEVAEPAPAPVGAGPSEIAAAEPVAALESIPESRPVGLLALTAIVCVLGVVAGTIRAIVSQRASRTRIA
jgi:hypothetical protein